MGRQFLANLSFLVLLNVIVKPVYILGIEVSVQNTVGAEIYGVFFALLNSAYLFQILNDFGLQIYQNRHVAHDGASLPRLFSGLLQIKGVLALVFMAAAVLFVVSLGLGKWLALAVPVVFNLVLMSLVLFLRSGISGLGFYKTDSALSVLDKLLMILICGYLLWFESGFSIYHFVYAQMVSLGVTALVAFGILRSKATLTFYRLRWPELRDLLIQAGPYALAVFLMSLYTRVDGVMIERLADNGAYEAGLYAAGYRLLDAANMLAFLFAVLLLPMFTRLLADRTELIRLLGQAFRFMWMLTIAVSSVAFFYRNEVMGLLYDEMTASWGEVFGLLILSFSGVGMMYVFGTLITATGRLRRMNVLFGCFVVINVVANFLLIPLFAARGAALATLGTQLLVAFGLFVIARQYLQWQLHFRHTGVPLLFMAGCTVIAYSSTVMLTSIPWTVRCIVAIALICGLSFLLRLIRIEELSSLLHRPGTPG